MTTSLIGPSYAAILLVGIAQIIATKDGFAQLLGLPEVLAWIAAFAVRWTPLVGTVIGVVGATMAWGWSWQAALGLFVFPFLFHMEIGGIAAAYEALRIVMALARRPRLARNLAHALHMLMHGTDLQRPLRSDHPWHTIRNAQSQTPGREIIGRRV